MQYMLQLRACQHLQGELSIIKTLTTHDIEVVKSSLKTLAFTASKLARDYKSNAYVLKSIYIHTNFYL